MPRCELCHKKAGLNLITCKFCEKELCTRCIDMSIHKCEKIDKYVEEKRKALEDSLLENKTVDKKCISI